MSSDIRYFVKGQYIVNPFTIYADYIHADCPEPLCRKYHISSEIDSAQAIAEIALPYLMSRDIYHKVVQNKTFLIQQTTGIHRAQRGKFITVYMDAAVAVHNPVMNGLFHQLVTAAGWIKEGPRPMLRLNDNGPDATLILEEPVYNAPHGRRFIYGGFECDPTT
ncbi:MAG: hypothetical protein KDJ54_19200 [Candidatus Competibacteraceae bacterium]|nr:hypothetical protein [Candidatus Competibacteraceae bacterium]